MTNDINKNEKRRIHVIYDEHVRGQFTVRNGQIVDKYNDKVFVSPAILVDLKYGCTHRIDEASKLEKDYPELMRRLKRIGKEYSTHVVLIKYDQITEQVYWGFDKNNHVYLPLDKACAALNFITTCGNEPKSIRKLLLSNDVEIHKITEELQMFGY